VYLKENETIKMASFVIAKIKIAFNPQASNLRG
jgi:hypothetical protein